MIKISVILPVYNAQDYLKDCIESVLNQTFNDFELLVIDDCSTDNSVQIIKSYHDERIRLYIKEKNSGYTNSLNWAIKEAKGKYIARMDADDICHPQRLEKQLSFLKKNPDVLLCGTNAQIINSSFYFDYPQENYKIKVNLLFGNSFVHPSIMGLKKTFKKHIYNPLREPAEDYDLFTRLIKVGKLANLKEVLLYYRVHDKQISNSKKEKQEQSARESMLRMFKLLNYNHIIYDDNFVKNAIWPYRKVNKCELKKILQWFLLIDDKYNNFDPDLLATALLRKRYNVIKYYLKNPQLTTDNVRFYLIIKMLIHSPKLFMKFIYEEVITTKTFIF